MRYMVSPSVPRRGRRRSAGWPGSRSARMPRCAVSRRRPAGSRRPSCAGRARRARRSRLARGGQVLPAGDRAAAPRGAAQAHGREVVDREVAHGVVERQLLPGADRPAGDEVECVPVVEADTAVGVAGVVDLRSHSAVARPAAGTHLRRVRVVAVSAPTRKPTMTVSPAANGRVARTPSPLPSAVRRSSTPSSSGTSVRLASRCARTGDLPPRDAVAPGGLDG